VTTGDLPRQVDANAMGLGATVDDPGRRAAMREEAERIEAWGRAWDAAYRNDANHWSQVSGGLGFVSAGLGAAAGYTGLAQVAGAFGVSLIALAAAVVSAIASTVRPAAKGAAFGTSATANSSLSDRARVFRLTQVEYDPIDTVLSEFTKLCDQRDAAVKGAPIRRAPGRKKSYGHSAWPYGYTPEGEVTVPRAAHA
jgi:hypothetical protein